MIDELIEVFCLHMHFRIPQRDPWASISVSRAKGVEVSMNLTETAAHNYTTSNIKQTRKIPQRDTKIILHASACINSGFSETKRSKIFHPGRQFTFLPKLI